MATILEKDVNNNDFVRIIYSDGIKINNDFITNYIDKLSNNSLRLFLKLLIYVQPHTNYLTDKYGNKIIPTKSVELDELIHNNLISISDNGFYVINPFMVGGGVDIG